MASKGKSNPVHDSRTTQFSNSTLTARNDKTHTAKPKVVSYASEGVKDNDIFSLPSSDWQLLGLVTLIGAFVRLFRLSQPSSVVFDEVQ
jgi:dolichyl-phosphate-mannose-protein mannosyltransferase